MTSQMLGLYTVALFDFTLQFVFIAVMFIIVFAIIASLVIRGLRERTLERFSSSIRVEGNKLYLPSVVPVDIGDIYIEGYWVYSGRSRHYHSKIELINQRSIEAPVLDLDSICSSPFYVYANRGNEVLAVAPGFIIKGGEYRDILVLCLDASKIPARELELGVAKESELAFARVKVGPGSYEALVKWISGTPVEEKLIYDEEKGGYRIIEEYEAKPRARGARVEICFKKPRSKKTCREIAKTSRPGEEAKGVESYKVNSIIIALHKKLLVNNVYRLLSKAIETHKQEITAGYREGFISAKTILDIPLARDTVDEKPI